MLLSHLKNRPPRSLAVGMGKRFAMPQSAPSAKPVLLGRNAETEDEKDRGESFIRFSSLATDNTLATASTENDFLRASVARISSIPDSYLHRRTKR